MENKYIIKDWAGNILDFKGSFKLSQFAVPMEFETEDHANEYITLNMDDDREDLYVEVKS